MINAKYYIINSLTHYLGSKRDELLVNLLEIDLTKLNSCSNQLLNKRFMNTKLCSIIK